MSGHIERYYEDRRYSEELRARFVKNELPAETMTPAGRDAMVEEVLDPSLKPGLYLELGCASSPYAAWSSRRFNEEALYLALDGGRSRYPPSLLGETRVEGWAAYGGFSASTHIEWAVRDLGERPDSAYLNFCWGDAQRMPLPDFSPGLARPVREVFMSNVLITAGVHYSSIDKIMYQQARVLNPSGYLIIRDEALGMPTQRHSLHEESNLWLLGALDKAGFGRRAWVGLETSRSNDNFPAQQVGLCKQFPRASHIGTILLDNYLICQMGEGDIPRTPEKPNPTRLSSLRERLRRAVGRGDTISTDGGLDDD